MSCFYASVHLKGNNFTQKSFNSSATGCSYTFIIYLRKNWKNLQTPHRKLQKPYSHLLKRPYKVLSKIRNAHDKIHSKIHPLAMLLICARSQKAPTHPSWHREQQRTSYLVTSYQSVHVLGLSQWEEAEETQTTVGEHALSTQKGP